MVPLVHFHNDWVDGCDRHLVHRTDFAFAIIFMWTPPHFWALALVKNDDYTCAYPHVAGGCWRAETRRQIVIYAVLMAPLAVVPSFIGMASLELWGGCWSGGCGVCWFERKIMA